MMKSKTTGAYLSQIQFNLLKILESSGPLTRNDIVEKLKKPRTTVYDNLRKLERRKIVEKYPHRNGNCGRPEIYWKLRL